MPLDLQRNESIVELFNADGAEMLVERLQREINATRDDLHKFLKYRGFPNRQLTPDKRMSLPDRDQDEYDHLEWKISTLRKLIDEVLDLTAREERLP